MIEKYYRHEKVPVKETGVNRRKRPGGRVKRGREFSVLGSRTYLPQLILLSYIGPFGVLLFSDFLKLSDSSNHEH